MKRITTLLFVALVLFLVGCAQSEVKPVVVAPTPSQTVPAPAKQTQPATAPAQAQPSATSPESASSKSGISTCTDSDGGRNYAVKGTITGTNYLGKPYNYTDNCTGGTVLQEYYCDDKGAGVYFYYKCPNGCSEGICR